MSGERSVDVEKINNNEKGFEPAHIRSVISLALFSFVFLGMEFFFDSRAAEFVDARSVLLYQSVILLASAVGLFIYALIERYVGSKIKQIIIITLNIVEVAALAAIILCSGKLILLYGIIFFIVCGVMGGRVYHDVSRDYTDRKHLTVIVGISYALGLLLQYINYNLIDNVILRMVMFSLAIVALAVILFLARDEYAEADTYMVDERNKTDCKEKCDETTPDSGSVAVALVMVVLLMTFIFSALDNVVTVVHAEGGADVGQWPRLFLALSGVAAGFLFDIKDQRFMNQMMYCVTVLSVIAMLIIEFGGAFIIGLIVFYLAAGFFVVYFTTGFTNVSYGMRWSALWSGAGRAVNNIGAGIVGIISYMLIDSPGIMVMSVVVILLLVLISIAVFVLENLQKGQYRRYDEEKVTKSAENSNARVKVDFECFADAHHLTGREREVLQKLLVSDGSVQDIADELYISRASLYRHISSMNEKTGTKTRVGLIQYYYGWHEE
jgi:DNA-binding CsgD family transcriptional regulator